MAKKSSSSFFWSFIGEIIALIVVYWVLVYLLPSLSFVTPSYRLWLPVGLKVAFLTAALHLTALIFTQGFLSRLLNFTAHALSWYSLYVLTTVFPFNFAVLGVPNLNQLVQLALSISVFVLFIILIVKFIRLFL